MMESMQPVYGQTKGLGNKAISKAVAQALEELKESRVKFRQAAKADK